MRIRARQGVTSALTLALLLTLALASSACGWGSGLFRQYEYEEELYLSLDGSATAYVNSSIPALNALRGTSFDTNPSTRVDRDAVRAYFSSPDTHVTRVTTSRRNGRQFIHVRMSVDDVRRLAEAVPLGWSTYDFRKVDSLFVYTQMVGPSAGRSPGPVSWNGRETVAFRLHLPSKIAYHNTRRNIARGNILVWEQSLDERLRGIPVELEARMETQSILYRTLWLFGWTFVAVAIAFVIVIWRVLSKGSRRAGV